MIEVLKRDSFRCTLCSSKKDLEVHHIEPLRNIIDSVLSELQIQKLSEINQGSDLFETIISKIISKHTTDIGVTLCKFCHSEVDNKRHVKNLAVISKDSTDL